MCSSDLRRFLKESNLSKVCQFNEKKVLSDVREVRSNITQTLNKGCRLWQQTRVESELLETKQRSFCFDVSHWNQVLRMETQQSRIECQLTFERYGSLCRLNNYSSSPNGLLTQSP